MNNLVNLDYNTTDNSYFILSNEKTEVLQNSEDNDNDDNEEQLRQNSNTVYTFEVKLTDKCNPYVVDDQILYNDTSGK